MYCYDSFENIFKITHCHYFVSFIRTKTFKFRPDNDTSVPLLDPGMGTFERMNKS